MSALPQATWTAADYLAFERQSETRHEFRQGAVVAMAGASRVHNLIVAALSAKLYAQIEERPCELYSENMRVKVSATGLYTYPDVIVTCEPPRFEDAHGDSLLNPAFIAEIVSPSTEAYDRGEKFRHYRALPALRTYVLIAQRMVLLECFERQADDSWKLTAFSDPAAQVDFPAIACAITLGDLYRKVRFGADGDT